MTLSQDPSRAFDALYDVHSRAVLRYLLRRAPRATAEDALAETFLVVWRRLDDVPDDALPWMLGIARRVLANQRRGEERRLALLDLLRQRQGHESFTWESMSALSDDMTRALLSLSDKEREALLLTAWEGLSAERAAVAAGCSAVAFRVRLHRARRGVAAALDHVERVAARRPLTGEEAR